MSRYAEGGEVRPHDPGDSVPGALTDTVYGPCEHHSARTPCHCNPITDAVMADYKLWLATIGYAPFQDQAAADVHAFAATVRRDALTAAERRMFGTEDGELIGGSSEFPAGELRRLLWEGIES